MEEHVFCFQPGKLPVLSPKAILSADCRSAIIANTTSRSFDCCNQFEAWLLSQNIPHTEGPAGYILGLNKKYCNFFTLVMARLMYLYRTLKKKKMLFWILLPNITSCSECSEPAGGINSSGWRIWSGLVQRELPHLSGCFSSIYWANDFKVFTLHLYITSCIFITTPSTFNLRVRCTIICSFMIFCFKVYQVNSFFFNSPDK